MILKDIIKHEFEELIQKMYADEIIPESFEIHEYLEENRIQLNVAFNATPKETTTKFADMKEEHYGHKITK